MLVGCELLHCCTHILHVGDILALLPRRTQFLKLRPSVVARLIN
jgi:hypothetical protein